MSQLVPTTPNYVPQIAPIEEESLKSVLRALRRHKRWIGCFALGGFLLALVACIVLQNQYQSMASVQVGKDLTLEVELSSSAGSPTLSQSDTKTDIATHMAVLMDNSTALAVIRDLDLEKYKPFKFKPSLMGYLNGSNKRIQAEMGKPLSEAPERRERLLALFGKKLEVKNPADTRLITVAFMNPDRDLAAKIANAIVREYVQFESQEQSGGGEGIHALSLRLDELQANMENAQKKLAEYEQQTGLNSLLVKSMGGSGGGSYTHIPVLDRLDLLNQTLTASETNRIGKEAIYNLTRTKNPDVVAGLANSSIAAIATSSVVTQGNGLELLQNLRQQLGSLQVQYSAASTTYGAKSPRLMELQSQIDALNKQISDEVTQINLRAKNDYEMARGNEDGLRSAYAAQTQAASQMNQSAVTLQVLVQQADAARQLYDGLNQQIQQASVQAGLRATNIRITDPARPNYKPKRPNPPIYLAVGLALGLLLGVPTAFIREHMDETVKSILEVNPLTPLPVLASIPLIRDGRSKQLTGGDSTLSGGPGSETSPLILRPRSSAAEAYRTMRTAILRSLAGQQMQTMLVTSPLIGEGKTTVSYNTGVVFAQAGERVLLIDADMHHPHLHDQFAVSQAPGLSEFLGGDKPLGTLIRPHPTVRNLSLLSAGDRVAVPSELLGSLKFDEMMEQLKASYSTIIIDGPPMLLIADAMILAGKADAVLAVIRSEVTSAKAVERMSEILQRDGDRAIGVVLNGVDPLSVEYYRAYGHNVSDKYFEEN